MHINCGLCKAVRSGRYKRINDFIFIPRCSTCGDPMLVYIHHVGFLSKETQKSFEDIVKIGYPDYRRRDIGMMNIQDHWCEHLIKEG